MLCQFTKNAVVAVQDSDVFVVIFGVPFRPRQAMKPYPAIRERQPEVMSNWLAVWKPILLGVEHEKPKKDPSRLGRVCN